MSQHDGQVSHDEAVPDNAAFSASRALWRAALAGDDALRAQAVELQQAADEHRFTYTWQWLGVPVIRLPDDVMVLQELFWSYRPQRVVETGVARGGSMLLDASLMRLSGETPAVLGIDIHIFPHTYQSLEDHPVSDGVRLLESDSTTAEAGEQVASFLSGCERAVLVLDSNHTHEHVLAELRLLAPLLPVGGFVLVADTIIEEFPPGYYADRPWDRGNSPATALGAFLEENQDFQPATEWWRRALVTEFRDAIVRRVR